jgi:hypothetical protein
MGNADTKLNFRKAFVELSTKTRVRKKLEIYKYLNIQ